MPRRSDLADKILHVVEALQQARSENDTAAVADFQKQLIKLNTGLVHKVAQRYSKFLSIDDLVQEGNLGLLHAADLFDIKRGTAFSTFVTFHLRARMGRLVSNTSRTIRVPAHVAQDITKINRAAMQFPSADVSTLSAKTGLTTKDIERAAEAERVQPCSTEKPLAEGFTVGNTIGAPFVDPADALADEQALTRVRQAIETLPDRDQQIAKLYFFEERTLQEIGDEIGLSRQGAKNNVDRIQTWLIDVGRGDIEIPESAPEPPLLLGPGVAEKQSVFDEPPDVTESRVLEQERSRQGKILFALRAARPESMHLKDIVTTTNSSYAYAKRQLSALVSRGVAERVDRGCYRAVADNIVPMHKRVPPKAPVEERLDRVALARRLAGLYRRHERVLRDEDRVRQERESVEMEIALTLSQLGAPLPENRTDTARDEELENLRKQVIDYEHEAEHRRKKKLSEAERARAGKAARRSGMELEAWLDHCDSAEHDPTRSLANVTPTSNALYTADEVARMLHRSVKTVYRLASQGEIPCKHVRRAIIFPRVLIDRWFAGENVCQPTKQRAKS